MAVCEPRDSVAADVLAAVCCKSDHYESDLYISKLIPSQKPSRESGNIFVNWAKSHPHLKVAENVIPEGILPEGVTGKLADIKVFSRGPDDAIYDKDHELRQKVARGNTFLELDNMPWQCVIYALKKFTGGMGDDDDRSGGGNNSVWKNYFTRSLDEATSVLALKKANGEAAHMSCIKINRVPYICLGSKNVHMLIRRKSDIEKYVGERYRVAAEVAIAVLEFLEKLPKEDVKRLLDFLDETRLTAVFEILNPTHQHVEDLSYLGDKCALKFITWTSNDVDAENELCVLPPDLAMDVANHLGFDPVKYNEISATEAETHMLQIRKQYGFEGEVFYYLDSERNVIGLLKKKTAWYIICRAIREKVRNALFSKKGFDQVETSKRICRRIKEIQRWLNLCNESTAKWQKLGTDYLDWVVSQKTKGKMETRDVADLFPVTWTRFLEETDTTDKITYSDSVVC